MPASVTHNHDLSRYEISMDGQLAGFAEFVDADGMRTFTHTEIEPRFGGRGVGSELVRAALDATRADGWRIVAACSFVAAFIDRHPDYRDLLA